MCCNNFHIVIFSGCHLTTTVVFSPVIGVSTLNYCVVIVSILFLCERYFLNGKWCIIPNILLLLFCLSCSSSSSSPSFAALHSSTSVRDSRFLLLSFQRSTLLPLGVWKKWKLILIQN
ncbi:uncharacterized protein DS421_9g279530 [Arachis hypogaea]|nr:uncharacterized protein DS421_9g279530 [Arachis hypogaea]